MVERDRELQELDRLVQGALGRLREAVAVADGSPARLEYTKALTGPSR